MSDNSWTTEIFVPHSIGTAGLLAALYVGGTNPFLAQSARPQ